MSQLLPTLCRLSFSPPFLCQGSELSILRGLSEAQWASLQSVVGEIRGATDLSAALQLLITHGLTEVHTRPGEPWHLFAREMNYFWARRPVTRRQREARSGSGGV